MSDLALKKEMVDESICLVQVAGFLDAHTFEQMDEAIADLFGKGVYKIVGDLSGLEYISSAGAGVFIGALTTAQENGGNVVLLNPQPSVYEVFDLLGLTQIFTITKTKDEALAAF